MDTNRVKLLEKYLKEDPNDPFNKYALALELADAHPDQTALLFEDLLKNHPDYSATYYQAANFFFEMDQNEKAKEVFESGIDLLSKGNEEKALQELRNSYQNFLFETEH